MIIDEILKHPYNMIGRIVTLSKSYTHINKRKKEKRKKKLS